MPMTSPSWQGGLTARAARDGEKVLALNEKEYTLEPFMTVIADDAQVHDIGGIMGGEDSGVSEATTEVMLEVAYFTPERIARTGQALGLTSDARSRFERGVDPAFLDDGLAILTGLILDICGGEPSAAIRAGAAAGRAADIAFDFGRTKALGGIEVPEAAQREILDSLGFEVAAIRSRSRLGGATSKVRPTWSRKSRGSTATTRCRRRRSIARRSRQADRDPIQLIERRVRRTAAARGLDEAVTWSFISEGEAEAFGGGEWRLANPISEEMKVMRPSLLPGLIAAARRNLDRGAAAVRLFEIGRRYLGDAEHPTLVAAARRAKAVARLADRQGQGVRRVRRQSRSRWRCSKRRRAGRQPAGVPDAGRSGIPAGRPSSASVQRRSSPASANFIPGCQVPTRRPARSPPRFISTRFRRRATSGTPATYAAGAPGDHPRFRLHRSSRSFRRGLGPRDPRRGQGGDHRRRLFDRFETADGLWLRSKSRTAGRKELHRRGDRRYLEADRHRRGKAGARLRS